LQLLIGRGRDAERFLADVYAAEDLALCGHRDFAEGLAEVARRWQCAVGIERLLGVWTEIHVEREVVDLVLALRERGWTCHLATNQEKHKARHMSEVLGYRGLFDREFYSCFLGVAKPALVYFSTIAEALALPPGSILFIDDRPENIRAAQQAGMHGAEFSISAGVEQLRSLLGRHGVRAA
jgi:putative hydrolase of the HAD superfamily